VGAVTTNNVTASFTYTPLINAINLTWTDPSAGTNTVTTKITIQTFTGSVDICSETQTGAAGNVNCNVAGYSGAVLVQVNANGDYILSEYVNLNSTRLGTVIGDDEGGFWAGMLTITVAMFGIVISPAAAIITMLIGLIAIYYLGIFTPLTATFLILAAVLSIALGWRLRN
jgi:hypothetical protein